MTHDLQDLLDPWIGPGSKGFPVTAKPVRRSEVAAQGWNLLRGDLPFPVAAIHEGRLKGNLAWMQRFARDHDADLAPHGKTTMTPEIFRRQLEAGAWGITVANVAQLRVAVAAGARNAIIANQVFDGRDLEGIEALERDHEGLRTLFLLDSLEQLALIQARLKGRPRDVLLELGVTGGRTGCRTFDTAMLVARGARASSAVRIAGFACFEGLFGKDDDAKDRAMVEGLMGLVDKVARACEGEDLIESDEVIVSAGGSALFDLVAKALHPKLRKPVRAVLRSGCYATHDDGMYLRSVAGVSRRMGCDVGLRSAIEVWTRVQSTPEPGLAILTAGKRDASYDVEMPRALRWFEVGSTTPVAAHAGWSIAKMNDQHAYLVTGDAPRPKVGDIVTLGISHPCTTFDKWRWMALVDDRANVVGAVTTCF